MNALLTIEIECLIRTGICFVFFFFVFFLFFFLFFFPWELIRTLMNHIQVK